ncbi:NADPH-dependent FMN reductase [Sphingomonas bacterium]|uniref:NADPH-dependent FMN reductase n=1 Tax=Sphingomonas bacterium TaxID=1895847 RepID=UPI001575468F|nr:NADPH-dependent FMN reductase [Sphingomonas bacterium]
MKDAITEQPLNMLAICGSLREKSFSAALVRELPGLAPGWVTIVESSSIGNVPHYDGDLEVASGVPSGAMQLGQMISDADSVVIVSPEYNTSIPGVLKNAIDWVSRVPGGPFANKPVLIASASPGPFGGVRMHQHLRQVLSGVGAYTYPRPDIAVGLAGQRFDEEGRLIDDAMRELIRKQLADFAVFTRKLIRELDDEDDRR